MKLIGGKWSAADLIAAIGCVAAILAIPGMPKIFPWGDASVAKDSSPKTDSASKNVVPTVPNPVPNKNLNLQSKGDQSPPINAGGNVNITYGEKPQSADHTFSNLDSEIKGRLHAAWERLSGLESEIGAGIAGIKYTMSDGPIYLVYAVQILDAEDPQHDPVTYSEYKGRTLSALIRDLQGRLPEEERKQLDQSLHAYDVLKTKADGENKALEKGPTTAAHMLSTVNDAKKLVREIGSQRWQDF